MGLKPPRVHKTRERFGRRRGASQPGDPQPARPARKAGRAAVIGLLRVLLDDSQFYATVLGPALGGAVVGNGFGLAVAAGRQ